MLIYFPIKNEALGLIFWFFSTYTKLNSDRATIKFIEAHMPMFTRLTSGTSEVSRVTYC